MPRVSRASSSGFAHLFAEKRVLLCVGSGGVGKTTCSAAIGLAAAQRGRRTLVLTIDPAKRLAASMGLEKIDHTARPVDPERFIAAGIEPAPLYVMMLDVRRTFDEIVERFAPDPAFRARIQKNRIYQEIAGRLTGSHEYAAMEKLRLLDAERQFDLIVLDTPPSRNALDFLEAPHKIAEAIDSPALQWFTRAGARGARGLGIAGAFILRRLGRFLGSGFLDEIANFLTEFHGLLGELRRGADSVQSLFHDPGLSFVLVTSAEHEAVSEAIYFRDRLAEVDLTASAVVVNRVHKVAAQPFPDDWVTRAKRAVQDPAVRDLVGGAVDPIRQAFDDFSVAARVDGEEIARLKKHCGELPRSEIPLLEEDVHDLAGLSRIGQYLQSA